MKEYIEKLNWRYSTKKFDPNKKLTDEQVDFLTEAMRLSASSYGLQPYKVMLVENADIRSELVQHSWGQKQVADASHLIVLCNYTEVEEHLVDEYTDHMAALRNMPAEKQEAFNKMLKDSLKNRDDVAQWAAEQNYIVLGNLLSACAFANIDACPMAGFIPEKYNKILGLNEMKLNATVVIPVGYRAADDKYAEMPKVRKPLEDFLLKK
ncbi:MAG: NAD(P)H-dependent oxidoreductase [Bacteroidota bacterium]|nr:NAD(P)H-dependent oxidoreductase [Bacteroidota bacterium]